MGLDLTILPQHTQGADFSHDIISLHRDSDLFDIIMELEKTNGREVTRNGINSFISREEDTDKVCYGKTTETPYGEIIKGVQAYKLKKVLKEYKTDSWKNKAFITFLNELPDELEIWLYWN